MITHFIHLSVVTLLVSMMLQACNNAGFTSKDGMGPRRPGTGNLNPGGASGGGSSGGTNRDGSEETFTGKSAPLKIFFNSEEARDNSKFNGIFEFKVTRADDSSSPVSVVSIPKGSSDRSTTVADMCRCGTNNSFKLSISAGGDERALRDWQSQGTAITSRTAPSSNEAPDYHNFTRRDAQKKNFTTGNHTIFLGGFDHTFLGGKDCGNFQCEGGWDNNDDVMVIFSCDLSACTDGNASKTELSFEDMLP